MSPFTPTDPPWLNQHSFGIEIHCIQNQHCILIKTVILKIVEVIVSPSPCPGVSSPRWLLATAIPNWACVCIEHGSLAKWHACPLYCILHTWNWGLVLLTYIIEHNLYTFGGAICLSALVWCKQPILEHCNLCLLFHNSVNSGSALSPVFTIYQHWGLTMCDRNTLTLVCDMNREHLLYT